MSPSSGHRRRSSRSSKPQEPKKRSTSSSFASLFATLTSFSGSGPSDAAAAPAIKSSTPISRGTKPLSSSAHAASREDDMSRRRTLSKPSAPSPKSTEPKLVTRRQSTPRQTVKQQQLTPRQPTPRQQQQQQQLQQQRKPSPQATKPAAVTTAAVVPATTTAATTPQAPRAAGKPDVFSFMSGEISTPPSPRPHGGSRNRSGMSVMERPVERSVASGQISSPTPRRPLFIPKPGGSVSSPSDSGVSSSTLDSPPDTPTPVTQALAASAKRSLERLTGQDAVGRSIRSDNYYRRMGRNQPTPPPEAPMPPYLQARAQHVQQSPIFDQSPASSGSYQYPMSPGLYSQSGDSSSMPYPTPPLDPQYSPNSLSQGGGDALVSTRNGSESLPRQYRILTQSTIKRTEGMIDGLEAELRNLDKMAPHWQREQILMRLSNTLVMHHRLVDIWSKISQLNRLNVSKIEDREKIEAVWTQLRQQYSHLSHVNGMGVDKFISNVVNDLVHVGERAQIAGKEDMEKAAAAESQDLRIIMILLGLIVTFLLLRDEIFQKFTIAAGVALGIYTLLHTGKLKGITQG